MAIKLKIVTKRDPRDVTKPVKYHGLAISRGKTDLEDLAELITGQSTMTRADVYGVLMALEHNMLEQLKEGRTVELGRIGNFQVGVSTTGAETKKDFSKKLVSKRRVLFRPGKAMKSMLKGLEFSMR
ncbi:HU family DNA-binding protein [Namhaeicola litoreus]|uniref:HU family DNA-binding protein n=1 Tax=Namhaeicola litoreus TaxID=1052145 RepID=A0ABW3Y5B4_9FLAO